MISSLRRTSRSTRIIHGGLRYLEHAEIGLVRESLRERERLLAQMPHLVRPLQFLLALPKNLIRCSVVRFYQDWLVALPSLGRRQARSVRRPRRI